MKSGIFLIFLLFFTNQVFAKYQVCSITINSDDEIKVFKKYLSPDHFEFTELLPINKKDYAKHDSHWFNEACQKGYKCDILIVSGHFGGTFFGSSEFTLPTELMEQKSCNKNCPGILSNAKEIFLFGCNTLADKTKDTRTYQEYLNVLLEDGMARETAERVVASRYSPLEASFYERMNFIFEGSRTVYGFDQLSPLGENIRGSLNLYFQSINAKYGSYHEYLKGKSYDRSQNEDLLNHLKHTTISQVHLPSLPKNIKKKELFLEKCTLLSPTAPLKTQIQSLVNIFNSGNSGSAFFAIDQFLSLHEDEIVQTKEGREALRYIKNNQSFSEVFKSFYQHLTHLPYIKIMHLNILHKLQWIDAIDFQIKLKQDILNVIQDPNRESYISILLLLKNKQIKKRNLYYTEEELPKGYAQNVWALLILEKLQIQAPHLQIEILEFCSDVKEKKAICYQALNTLAHMNPKDQLAQPIVSLLKNNNDEGLILYGLRVLGQIKTDDHFVHASVAAYLNHSNSSIKVEAIDALSFLKSPHADVQERLSHLLKVADQKIGLKILKSLSEVEVSNTETIQNILEYVLNNSSNEDIFNYGILSLKSQNKSSKKIIEYFHTVLNRGDLQDPSFRFVLQVMSKIEIKDISVYYKLSQFYKSGDESLKIAILDSISDLEWFHPEVQPELLNYLMDENKSIRRQALKIIKNIDNLNSKKMLRFIQSLQNETQEIEDLQEYLESL